MNTNHLPFLDGDAIAYTMAAIRNCRRRFFPFLWWYMNRCDLIDHSRSLAWLIIHDDQPGQKHELWNAVQRRLYREAKNDGWHRNRWSEMRYAQPVILAGDVEPAAALLQDDQRELVGSKFILSGGDNGNS